MTLDLMAMFKVFALVELAIAIAMFMTRGKARAFFTTVFGLLFVPFAAVQIVFEQFKPVTGTWYDITLYVIFAIGFVEFIQGLQLFGVNDGSAKVEKVETPACGTASTYSTTYTIPTAYTAEIKPVEKED